MAIEDATTAKELTDTPREVWDLYNQNLIPMPGFLGGKGIWNYLGIMNKGQKARYSAGQFMDQIFPGSGRLVGLPYSHWMKSLFGGKGEKGSDDWKKYQKMVEAASGQLAGSYPGGWGSPGLSAQNPYAYGGRSKEALSDYARWGSDMYGPGKGPGFGQGGGAGGLRDPFTNKYLF
jgi:hypothetical protein